MKRLLYIVSFVLILLVSFSSRSFSQITSAQSGNWSDAATWTGGVVPGAADNVVISSGSSVTINVPNAECNNLTVTGNLYYDNGSSNNGLTVHGSVTVGGRFRTASANPTAPRVEFLTLYGDLTVNTGGTFDMRYGSGANVSVGRLLFAGSSNSTINLSLTNYNSSGEEFNSVEINKTGGAKVILGTGNLFMNNNTTNSADTLILTSGVIETGSNYWVTLRTSSGAIVGASSASYVNGNIGRGITNSGGTARLDFPAGDANIYRPMNVRFSAPSNATGHFVWVTLHTGNANTGSSTFSGGIDKVSAYRYYEVGYNAGSSGATAMGMYGFSPTYKLDDSVYAGNTSLRVAYSTDSRATWIADGPLAYITNPPDTVDSDSLGTPISVSTGTSIFVALARAQGTSDNPLPVELTSFTYQLDKNNVTLLWSTSTETNNSGFEIQKSSDNVNFEKVAFVKGAGTSTAVKNYSFIDENISRSRALYYRLKQIDFAGGFTYSKVIEISTGIPSEYKLDQNYPNPFNPATAISYQLSAFSHVTLKVYDALGREIETLVNEEKPAGIYRAEFNGSNYPSGIYYYRIAIHSDKIQAGNYSSVKKMILLK